MSLQRRLTIAHLGVAVAGVVGMLGASALWLVLSPQQQWILYPKSPEAPRGQALSLPLESYYRFTSIALFALGALVVGIVLAVAAWQIRFARGTPMVIVLVGSLAAGSGLGLLIGHLVRGGVDPAVTAASGVAAPTLVEMPASISRWAIVIAPGVAAVIYALSAAWHSDPDLGRPQVRAAVGGGSRAPFDTAGDPVTAPIPAVVGAAASPYGRNAPEAGSLGFHPDRLPTHESGVFPGPAVGAGPAIGAGPTIGAGPRISPGPAVTPGDGRPRTDPSPGTR